MRNHRAIPPRVDGREFSLSFVPNLVAYPGSSATTEVSALAFPRLGLNHYLEDYSDERAAKEWFDRCRHRMVMETVDDRDGALKMIEESMQ
jgi:hypothetical protein